MYHFVAFVWDDRIHDNRANAAQLMERFRHTMTAWHRVFSTAGIVVFASPPRGRDLRSYVLPLDAGIVLGRLFPKDCDQRESPTEPQIGEAAAFEITRTCGQRLVDDYWGGYVAFLRSPRGGDCFVIRDCSGKLPCYMTRRGGVEIIFSDIEDLSALDLPRFTLNRRFLKGFVYSSQLAIRECGLNEVTEILAGECVEIQPDSTRQFSIWDPRRIWNLRSIENYDEAIFELKATTQRCVSAWAAVYDSILLKLSGGFDSAVVLGCLSNAPAAPRVTCLNHYGDCAGDDERKYARIAAARAGAQLVERPRNNLGTFDRRMLSIPKTTKPNIIDSVRMLDVEGMNEMAMRFGAESVWTGQGGDHLFLQVRDCLNAADYFARYGLSLRLPSVIAAAARLSRQPYWSVLRTAWNLGRNRVLHVRESALDPQMHFLHKDALQDGVAEYVEHPWLAEADGIPKGKQSQIQGIAEVLHRHRPFPGVDFACQHHPLLSQPLIELCIQIPTYLLVRGGYRRALARDAFSDRIPTEIVERDDKGGAAGQVRSAIRRSEGFLRDILLDGILVNEGIVCRDALERYFVHGQPFRVDEINPLLASIAGELWARNWFDPALKVAVRTDRDDRIAAGVG